MGFLANIPLTIVVGGILLVAGLIRLLRVGRRPAGYPPGPPTFPIIGNLHQMPKRDAHLQFQKWAQEYGPVYSLILGTKTLVVLNTDQAVKDLLDKRSGIYSDRQDMYIGQELCSGGMRVLMMKYGPTWRMARKLTHNLLNVSAAKSYVPYQMLENKQMLYEILHTPDNVLDAIRRYSNSLTTAMTFGWRTHSHSDPALQQLFSGFEAFAVLNQTGTAALIDFYPFLRYLPEFLLPAQKKARELHRKEKDLYVGHWKRAKASIKDGTAKPCFCVDLARSQDAEGFSDDQAGYISGTVLEAGSDTTSSTLYAFVQAMVLYPDVQRKAQEQIDKVIGPTRPPTMGDEHDLQYIRAIVKETLRWMPTTIMGAVPHAVTKDDEYMGFLIPKGAGVVNNAYTINMDPKRAPNPRQFNPERYINDTASLGESAAQNDASKRDQFTFGAGRRICPGIHVAERSLFLAISRMLWAFDIKPKLDKYGKAILPDPEKLTQGFVCMPVEFECEITPRGKDRAEQVEKEWEEAKRLLEPGSGQWREIPEGMALSSL
ncbi:cytochrome P450 [Delitschia confertaspora ATCC 74209]|uniref:Cytochrome P450 n=1 Tax=Delitschia confertaspora ATCC 74209 TaxID=1513339 RepID=A0A9P4JKF4_9PLEO|nr:cytochrome P450 [Delitschia confertaspora ATCC 74209]